MKSAYTPLTFLVLAALTPSVSTPIALAEPPGFPDLNTFVEVPASQYVTAGSRGMTFIGFSTAEGINCGFSNPDSPDGQNQLIHCAGPLPGLQDVPATGSGPCETGVASQVAITHSKGSCADVKPTRKILGPGQKITHGMVTCAVGNGPLVACIDRFGPERGFVLQPSGSFVF